MKTLQASLCAIASPKSFRKYRPQSVILFCTLLAANFAAADGLKIIATASPSIPASSLELSRPIRSWEFLPIVGTRGAFFGTESGNMEAWVYPLKIFRDFHLTFLMDGRAIPAETLARTLIVHPESATIVYAGDNFSVRETFFVPVHQPGALVLFDILTEQPIEIQASFIGDFQLEWPAALGGTYFNWDASQHAFVFGEEQKKFSALVGSPSAYGPQISYQTNYSVSEENSFRLGVTAKGEDHKVLVLAASTNGAAEAQATYQNLLTSYSALLNESAQYYRDYLGKTLSLTLPDSQLQQAYDWSRISVVQGLVSNPALGAGLVAGYGSSGLSRRPGFAWFFGRDSFWTSFALNSIGDFATARTALEFIARFQRDDGKIPHEISQSANFVDWFKNYPYGYASADATPLYIIAVNDYVVRSGDLDFARRKWESLWKAYQFLRSTYDAQNFPQNFGFGHGWVEGGPLLPVKTEFYQSGLGLEALRSLANLASLTGKEDLARELQNSFERQRPVFNQAFWSPDKKAFAYALDRNGQRVDQLTVLTTVPMWFGMTKGVTDGSPEGLTDDDKAEATLRQLSGVDHQTDWGMRILSNRASIYDGSGYHYGSVWPLFTGWASVAQYRYHQAFPAYMNLRANALLALDGSLGHVAEVLSGDYYQPLSTNSPHQIWSAAMVISPILRGMLGLEADAQAHTVRFAPHVPAEWNSFSVNNLHAGSDSLDFIYQRTPGALTLEVRRQGSGQSAKACSIEFSPAISARTSVIAVELNGHTLPFHVIPSANDQHVTMQFSASRAVSTLRIRLKNDFGLGVTNTLPSLGDTSHGLRVLSESWNPQRTQLTLGLSGVAGKSYTLSVWNPSQIASVDGGTLTNVVSDRAGLVVNFPAAGDNSNRSFINGSDIEASYIKASTYINDSYIHQDVVLNFQPAK